MKYECIVQYTHDKCHITNYISNKCIKNIDFSIGVVMMITEKGGKT